MTPDRAALALAEQLTTALGAALAPHLPVLTAEPGLTVLTLTVAVLQGHLGPVRVLVDTPPPAPPADASPGREPANRLTGVIVRACRALKRLEGRLDAETLAQQRHALGLVRRLLTAGPRARPGCVWLADEDGAVILDALAALLEARTADGSDPAGAPALAALRAEVLAARALPPDRPDGVTTRRCARCGVCYPAWWCPWCPSCGHVEGRPA